jgi:predicted nucleotidyltransferase
MIFGLPETAVIKICEALSKEPAVEKAVLYGSRARGDFREGSDIDLTLKGINLKPSHLNKLILDLDELMLPWNIDLSVYSELKSPELKNEILKDGVDFYPLR